MGIHRFPELASKILQMRPNIGLTKVVGYDNHGNGGNEANADHFFMEFCLDSTQNPNHVKSLGILVGLLELLCCFLFYSLNFFLMFLFSSILLLTFNI